MNGRKRFSEQFQLNSLSKYAISDLTSEWLIDRQDDGIDDFSLKTIKVKDKDLLLTFTAEPTRSVGKSVLNISTDGKEVHKKDYTVQLMFEDPNSFIGSSGDFNEFSQREQKQLVTEYLDEGMARVHCSCPAFYYQAHWEQMASHDSTIYNFPGPSGTGVWKSKHKDGLNQSGITICKHIASVIDQIHDIDDDLLSELLSRDWGNNTEYEAEPIQTTPVEVEEPDVEPLLDTPIISNHRDDVPGEEEPEVEEPQLQLPAETEEVPEEPPPEPEPEEEEEPNTEQTED